MARVLSCAVAGVLLSGCYSRVPLPTLQGPESPGLSRSARGYLVWEELGVIRILRLPQRERHSLSLPAYSWGGSRWTAPDLDGRMAYFDFRFVQPTSLKRPFVEQITLCTISIDGSNRREVFSFTGVGLFEVGLDLALSPIGGRVAFLLDVAGGEYEKGAFGKYRPTFGDLQLWDVETRTRRRLSIRAIDSFGVLDDRSLAWFPDGRRLAYVSGDLARDVSLPRYGAFAETETDMLPVIHVLDTETMENRAVFVGINPIVSEDGRMLLASDGGYPRNWWRIELRTGAAEPITWPGDWRGPVAVLSNDRSFYRGLPTEGSEPRFTERYSPIVGPTPLGTVKITDLTDGRYETVVPYIYRGARVRFRELPQ